jgi:hypothetical protein
VTIEHPKSAFNEREAIMTFNLSTILALGTFLALAACSPAGPEESATVGSAAPSAGPTATVARLAASAAPSQSPMPEPANTQPLPEQGPYFVFYSRGADGLNLTFVGMDGRGRRDVPLPSQFDGGYYLSSIVSPDGRWMAYWTGSAGEISYPSFSLDPDETYDLQLHLLNIADGSTTLISHLLAADYPANFDALHDAIVDQQETPSPYFPYDLQGSFVEGIRSAAWSLDSRYLAFAGEMDGPSSDLYVYDRIDQTIRRLSSGLGNIRGRRAIQWSPDGKWIVYSSGLTTGMLEMVRFYAARPDGSAYREYPDEVRRFAGWLSDSDFLVTNDDNGVGTFRLQSADLESGGMTMIWKCPYSDIAFHPGASMLVFQNLPIEGDDDCQHPGLYRRSLPTGKPLLITGLLETGYAPSGIEFLGNGEFEYLVSYDGLAAYSISPAGEAALVISRGYYTYVSPDRQWVAFAYDGLRKMDASGTVSEPLTDMQIDDVNWRPDSTGFLFLSGPDMYYVSLPDQTISLIEGQPFPPFPDNLHIPHWQPDSEGYFFTGDGGLHFLSLREKTICLIEKNIQSTAFDPPIWVALPG